VNSADTIERVPIHTDADGVVRVAGTRVDPRHDRRGVRRWRDRRGNRAAVLLGAAGGRVFGHHVLHAAPARSLRLPQDA